MVELKKYVSIPVEVEAIEFCRERMADNSLAFLSECKNFTGMTIRWKPDGSINLVISLKSKSYNVLEGDYIVRSKDNNLSIVKPNVFKKNYVLKEEV